MAAKYQGRVATQLHGDADEEGESQPRPDDSGSSSPSDRASFRFMRGGLAIDEYRPCGNTAYEQELHKRVMAALSLSQPRDIGEKRFGIFPSSPPSPPLAWWLFFLLPVGYMTIERTAGVEEYDDRENNKGIGI